MFDLPVLINRCGVIAGPGQFGKTDQGVFTLWVARHVLGGPLSYTGFGGEGKQVRDLLHPRDLFQLIQKQVPVLSQYKGRVFCVGGGLSNSTSLLEYTQICEKETNTKLSIASIKETSPVDIPWYVTDARCAQKTFDWRAETSVPQIVHEISEWIKDNKDELQTIFA
jgi:CDP-paratose 2-epimerase